MRVKCPKCGRVMTLEIPHWLDITDPEAQDLLDRMARITACNVCRPAHVTRPRQPAPQPPALKPWSPPAVTRGAPAEKEDMS